MSNNKKEVWVGIEEITNDSAFQQASNDEFKEVPVSEYMVDGKALETETSRRDFLKYLGFGIGTAALAASCDIPVKKAIPYVNKPETIVPGVATYFASTFVHGGDYCPVLVKTREGRPIKIEGNSLSSITKGGTSARAQASVLSLYDTNRFTGPAEVLNRAYKAIKWSDMDGAIASKMNAASKVRIVANTIMSPSTLESVKDFAQSFSNTQLVIYDPVSSSALLEANEQSFGIPLAPDYHFDKADVIVSFGADFLGTWISPIEYTRQYAQNRKIKDTKNPKMSRHIQVESHMSLTGSNADNRILVKPSEQGAAIVALYNAVAKATSGNTVNGPKLNAEATVKIEKVAKELLGAKGHSLVVSGSNNKGEQLLVNAINNLLGNYGQTISFAHASMQRQGMDKNIQGLIKEMEGGQVDAVFFMDGVNPAYDLPNGEAFMAALAKVPFKVSFSAISNETSVLCDYVAPANHFLESWGDVQAKKGMYSLIQPTITPIFAAVGKEGTRQAEESLLRWAKSPKLNVNEEQPYLTYLQNFWRDNMYPLQHKYSNFQSFWDASLHDGIFETKQQETDIAFSGDIVAAAGMVSKPSSGEGLEIAFFETVNVGAGQYANNPWLQEMPDPVSRSVWVNYLAIPVSWDGGNSFQALNNLSGNEIYGEADMADLTVGDKSLTVTAFRQFGQMQNTVSIALGYGREEAGGVGKSLGKGIGVDVYPMLWIDNHGNTQYYATGVQLSDKVAVDKEFACVQYHHTMGVTGKDKSGKELNVDEKTVMTIAGGFQGGLTERSIIFKANSLNEVPDLLDKIKHHREHSKEMNDASLYPYEEYKEERYSQGHHWSMHIDLNACTGCGACQVACVAENNVPVVGKHEVHRHHEMTWLRIDRYFFGDYENPNVVYQPMMCQHCDNAPCENVCPVAATNHSSEGLNQMTYNRCIGTRYCANNCPYKVRRFNWLDYTASDLFPINAPTINGEEVPFGADNLTRMVLNPDVTVRSRGVIEKCSFCVQRIQEGKLAAKIEGRKLRDNDVKSACQTACPTGAIQFGDDNMKDSEVNNRIASPLVYNVLEEIDVRSSVFYNAKIVNRDQSFDA